MQLVGWLQLQRARTATVILAALSLLLCVRGLAASVTQTNLVLLFDKNCGQCIACRHVKDSKRIKNAAVLMLLERLPSGGFLVKRRWRATYGVGEGPKGCLYDYRTPEGRYFTIAVKDTHRDDKTYGYASIVTSYPNPEDEAAIHNPNLEEHSDKCFCQRNKQVCNMQYPNLCGRVCELPGSAISIHGGRASPTAGCVRLLDDQPSADGIHSKSIAELAEIVRRVPEQRVPLILVRQTAVGCQAETNTMVSAGCAGALRFVLDASAPPPRARVNSLLANAPGLPQQRSPAMAAAAGELGPGEAIREARVSISSVFATSEAKNCGPGRDEPCRAANLLAGSGAWCASSPNASLEWLRFGFAAPAAVRRVILRNGNWEHGSGSPLWYEHGHVSEIEIAVNGHRVSCSHPQSDPGELECDTELPTGSQATIRIQKSVPGEAGLPVCISGVDFLADEKITNRK